MCTYVDPFLPYMVTVSAATVAGESDPATILVYTQHGGM